MLESVNVERGGIKLWINRKPGNPVEDKKARWTIEHADKSAAEQNELKHARDRQQELDLH